MNRALRHALLVAALLAPPAIAAEPENTPATGPMAAAVRYLEGARELAVYALGFIGVNYRFGGTSPDAGFDCSGLVHHVFKQVTGLILPRSSNDLSKAGEKISETELQPGDLVFYNTRRRPFSHVGIYVGEDRFIHAPSRGGKVEIIDMKDRYWATRYNGARRVNF